MQLFVTLSCLVPWSVTSSAAYIRWQETLLLVPSHVALLGAFQVYTLGHVPDRVIGLSCLAIAATLFAFIIGAGRLLPFRVAFTMLAVVVTICGFTHMAAAVMPSNPFIWLTAYLSIVAVLLALIIAVLCPFVLRHVLPVLRALPHNEMPELQTPASSITPPPATPPAEQPAPQLKHSSVEPPQHDDARLLAAMDSSLDAFFIFDPIRDADGNITDFVFKWLSHNGEILLQKPRSEILGARLTDLLPIDPAPQSFEQYRLVQVTGKPYIHEFPLKQDDVYSNWMRHHVVKLEDGIAITVTDITERRHSEQYLLHLPQHDVLTGLPTRVLLDDRMLQAIARANRYRSKVAVFLVHLGSCQSSNELRRSSLEDHVFLAAANRLRSSIRATDSIIRLSGDDFVIVMSDIFLPTDIRRAAATLVTVLVEPIPLEGKPIQLTCSLGGAIYPDTAATVEDLLSAADVAMCRAQSEGKNKYVLSAPASPDEAQQLAG